MQPNEQEDCVENRISKKIERFAPSSSKSFIFKVHKRLRVVNEKAYEPLIVAIGPYHRGKENLQKMEEHKFRYLYDHLTQNGKNNANEYINALRSLESEARSYYAEPINLSTDDFIEMLLLDGCFVIEVIRKFETEDLRNKNDPIFDMDWMLSNLQRDLMLFENQLPLKILSELFDLMEVPDNDKKFMDLALRFFNTILPEIEYKFVASSSSDNMHLLLGLIHKNWYERSKFNKKSQNTDNGPSTPSATDRLLEARVEIIEEKVKKNSLAFIPSATELQEAGVKIEKADKGILFDITYENGVLQVPPLTIDDRTEAFLRNLIAYEQYYPDIKFSYICDYSRFMDCLINSKNDVEILCQSGIINNWLGNTEVISDIFNKITDEVSLDEPNFLYKDIFSGINEYCRKPWHKWLTTLKRDYFMNRPWAIISVLAAFILFVLTVVQTIFVVYSAFR